MSNLFSLLLKTTFISSLSFVTLATYAQESVSPDNDSQSIPATAINNVEIDFPEELRIFGNEAWVQVGYIVDKKGNVTEPIIEASIGNPEFEKAALKTLQKLKYTPAKFKDDAVEQGVSGVVIPFVLDQAFEGADASFTEKFNQMSELYNTDKLDEANAMLDQLAMQQNLTLLELSMLEIAKALKASKNGQPRLQLQHLRKASVNNGEYLPKEMLTGVLQKRFALASRYSLFDEAFRSYELLEQIDPLNDRLTPLAMMIAPLQNALNDGRNVLVQGEINERGYWHYTPLRRVFHFSAAEEGVKEFEPRCAHSNKRFTVNTFNEWKIPDSWGSCKVVIYGEPGAKFSLYEFATLGEQ